jgi:hypothetical protein
VTILLAMNEWVAPGSNNTCTLKLFISSVPATTSYATLTSSCVRWKTLPGVRSFCALGLPRLEFAPDWEDLTAYSRWLTVGGSDWAAYSSVPVQCSFWGSPSCNDLFHHSNDTLDLDTGNSSTYDLLLCTQSIARGKLSSP